MKHKIFGKLIMLEVILYCLAFLLNFNLIIYYYAHIIVYGIAYIFFTIIDYKNDENRS